MGISGFKKNFAWVFFLLFYLFSFLHFLDAYYIHSPAKNAAWQYGYKEIVQFISPIQINYQKIYIPQGSDQPYIFFLFYQLYPPYKFQRIASEVTIPNGSGGGMNYISKLDNIEFIDLGSFDPSPHQSFLVVLPEGYSLKSKDKINTIHQVKDFLGITRYSIAEYKSEL